MTGIGARHLRPFTGSLRTSSSFASGLVTPRAIVVDLCDMKELARYFLDVSLIAISSGSLGMVFGNVTALTMSVVGPQTGTAAALMGMFYYLISAGMGYIASLIVSGPQVLPLAIAYCGSLAILLYVIASRSQTATRPISGLGL